MSLLAALPVFATVLSSSALPAQAHTCGSDWCSGNDGNSANNQQGNAPQIYMGESGVYYWDQGGSGLKSCSVGKPDYACFINSTASAAQTRYAAGTGLGVGTYYFAGGANSEYAAYYTSPYCFGAIQGYDDYYYTIEDDYYSPDLVTAIDIEQPAATGWDATASADRAVFDGFTDYVSGRFNEDTGCELSLPAPSITFQYAAYSSPNNWQTAFGTGSSASIPNTLEWTTEECCTSSWPGANWGGAFESFGSSNYDWMRQFYESNSADYDDAYEPIYLPVLSENYGG